MSTFMRADIRTNPEEVFTVSIVYKNGTYTSMAFHEFHKAEMCFRKEIEKRDKPLSDVTEVYYGLWNPDCTPIGGWRHKRYLGVAA